MVTLVMDAQRDEVDKLIAKAGVDAQSIDLTNDASPAHNRTLAAITGAQAPTGVALPEPGQQQQKKSSKPKAAKPRSGGGRGGASRGGSSRGGATLSGKRGNTPRGKGSKAGGGASSSNKPSRSNNSRRRSW